MEKSGKNVIFSAKRHLENSLGDDWLKYLSHLRKFFRNGNKFGNENNNFNLLQFLLFLSFISEFDREIRSFLTNKQIYYHNNFLLAVLNSADVTESSHQAPSVKTEEIVVEQQTIAPIPKRRRKNDEIVFQVHPIHEFVKPMDYDPSRSSIRYAAQELFLPDTSLIYGVCENNTSISYNLFLDVAGRFLAGCWENNIEFVDEQAIEMIVLGVQMMLKNILSHCIRQRKNYRVTSDKKFYYDVGCEFKNLDVRNTVTRQKIDSEIPTIERKAQDDSIYLSAHEDTSHQRRKISLLDIYKTLSDKNVIPSHSISILSIERLTTLINL